MSSPRWSAVLFDLDGTLVDTIGLILASYDHAIRTVLGDIDYPPEQARAWIGRPLRDGLAETYPEHALALEEAYRPWNLENSERLTRRYPGIEDMLRAVLDEDIRVGVVTSKRLEPAQAGLRHAGIDGLIDVVASLESTDRHKPDPAPLLHGAARLSTPTGRCAYVGDAVVDVLAATAAGMASIAVTWGAGDRRALADAQPEHVVDDAASLSRLLLGPAEAEGTGTPGP